MTDGSFVTLDVFALQMRRLVVQAFVDRSLLIDPDRIQWQIAEVEGNLLIRALLDIATKEEIIDEVKYPSNWWQAFKERWLPKWLRRRFPVEYTTLAVEYKLPELDVPAELGRKFVTLKLIKERELKKWEEGTQEAQELLGKTPPTGT